MIQFGRQAGEVASGWNVIHQNGESKVSIGQILDTRRVNSGMSYKELASDGDNNNYT